MLKQNLQPDYTQFRRTKQLVLPLETDHFIAPNESVRLFDHVMDELDYTDLYRTYARKGRKPGTEPATMAKIAVYAYSQGIYSTREIERACRYDLRFHYLLQRQKVPDHNTICRFIGEHLGKCMEGLLNQLIRVLAEAGEITFDQIFLDGTKIEANANRYTFVWRGSVEKNLEKLQVKAKEYLRTELGMTEIPDPVDSDVLKRVWNRLKNRAEKEHVVFVHGAGKHKTELQRQYETVEEMFRRAVYYEEALRTLGKDRNSYSKTDPDATFMHMKDDHMRNSQLKPGYNVQAASTSEYIVGIQIHSDRTDYFSLIPMLEHLGKCYKGKYGRKIEVAERFDEYRAQSEKNISSEEGILLRINRSIQAEGIFGITKQDMGYDRFLRRGAEGVKAEYLLLAFSFNLNKLHHRIQEGRLGKHLLIPKSMQESA